MNVVIIEEDKPSALLLQSFLLEEDPSVRVIAVLRSVAEMKDFFSVWKKTDLIFMDFYLKNENSLDVLNQLGVPAPIIFVTASAQYRSRATEQNFIDYILKPIEPQKIKKALKKYNELKAFFNRYNSSGFAGQDSQKKKYRQRFLLKKGQDYFFIKAVDVAFFYIDQSIVFIVDFNNQRFISGFKTLQVIEEELDPTLFFRVNRNYLINIQAIKKFRATDRVKLTVELSFHSHEKIIVSQDNVSSFKNWVGEKPFLV